MISTRTSTVPATVASILELANDPPKDARSRLEVYRAAKALMYAVELSTDTDHRLLFGGALLDVVKTASEMKVFDTLAADPDREWAVEELAKTISVDPALLHRILRCLNASGLVHEVAAATHTANHITTHLASQLFVSGMKHHGAITLPTLRALPNFLRSTNYRNPTTSTSTALHQALHAPDGIMGYLTSHPDIAAMCFEYMALHKAASPTWMDESIIPTAIKEKFKPSDRDLNAGRVMMVDVGGGSGHQCIALRKTFPELSGRMVVQDVPVMIEQTDKEDMLKEHDLLPQAHDFFTPQPTSAQGAKVYHLRTVLHDWPDDQCRIILKHLRDAMAPDSVLVVDEIVLPAIGADFKQMNFDIAMLACTGAMERTEAQWRALLESVGLKLRDVWVYDEDLGAAIIVGVLG